MQDKIIIERREHVQTIEITDGPGENPVKLGFAVMADFIEERQQDGQPLALEFRWQGGVFKASVDSE